MGDLAEYARGSSPNEVTTVKFDIKPDDQNPFWQTGATGESLVLYHFVGDEECELTFHDLEIIVTVQAVAKASREDALETAMRLLEEHRNGPARKLMRCSQLMLAPPSPDARSRISRKKRKQGNPEPRERKRRKQENSKPGKRKKRKKKSEDTSLDFGNPAG